MTTQYTEKAEKYAEGEGDSIGRKPSEGPSLSAVNDKSLQHINWKLAGLNLWSLIAAMNYGFAAACIGSTLGQPNFFSYFKLDLTSPNLANIIGIIVGIQSIGGAIGVISVCWIQDRWGRKTGFLYGFLWSIFGAALAAGSRNTVMMVFARLFTGIGTWSGVLSSIVYQAEIAPTTVRGLLGGSVGVGITFGYVIAAWVGVGFFYMSADINWRLPLILQLAAPLIALSVLYFVPESPRWLSLNHRHDEALQVLLSIHHSKRDATDSLARAEHVQIMKQAELDSTFDSSWKAMFTKYRNRSFVAILILFANQATGVQIVTNYGPTVYGQLGLTGSGPLMVNAGWLMWAWVSDSIWCLAIDRVGRRPLIVYGTAFAAAMLSIMVAMIKNYVGPDVNNRAGQYGTVFMFYMFVFAYSTAEPVMYLYIGEIFPTPVRVKGIALGLMSLNLTAFWGTMAQPAGVASIGWKFYMVFVCVSWFNVVLVYFFVKETRDLPLEEIAAVYGDEGEVAVHAKATQAGVHHT